MSDEPEKTAEDSGPVGGERLRVARRENDISIRDIAKELHLDEQKVRALEKNEFDILGAPVFAKGHLRKYAELVGVSTDDIMADYYQMNRAVGAPPVVGPKRKSRSDVAPGPWIVIVALVAAAAVGAYWWSNKEPTTPAEVAPAGLAPFDPGAQQPATVDEAMPELLTEPDTSDIAASMADNPTTDAPQAEDVATPESEPGTAATAGAVISEPVVVPDSGLPQVQVELTFTGECWTEVSDASGRRLYYDLGRPGRSVTLAGDAPLRVILGDVGNVSVRVNGGDYTVPQSALTGRLARLTLDVPR